MDFFEVVHTQRSIRKFKPDPVPEEDIWAVLDAAIRAPSGSNLQPWGWVVVRDAAKRRAISDAVRTHFESMGRFEQIARSAESLDDPSRRLTLRRAVEFFKDAGAAPVIIIPCLVNVSSPTDDPQHLLAGSSIYGAVQNMMLAARAKGIGTVLTTFQPMIDGTLRERLGIPPEAVPACIVPMGYPDEQRFGPTTRKPVETVVHWDAWGVAGSRAG